MPKTTELSAPEISVSIEYSKAAMEQIRERAEAGLRALPRIGIGVGGLLLGERQGGKIRVLDSIEIPCSHANGPSFNLTDEEKQNARELAAGSKTRLVGWYCSKTRGEAVLNDFDMKFFEDVLPGSGKIVLLVRPSLAAPMRAVFSIRGANGVVTKALECEVAPWTPEEDESAGAEKDGKQEETPQQIDASASVVEPLQPVKVEPVKVEPVKSPEPATAEKLPLGTSAAPPASPVIRTPASSTFTSLFGASSLEPPEPRRGARKLICVLAAASLSAAGGALFVTKDSWMPKPPLTLSSSTSDGSVTIRWNTEALRSVDHATIYINDGGDLETLPLDRLRLDSGFLIYTPKSQRVTAKMDAAGVTAITAWLAPPPAQTPAAAPEKVSKPIAAPGSPQPAPSRR